MNAISLLLRGVLAALAISASIGPVNVLVISRTLSKGKWAGIFSGVGAACADIIYGAVAGFSISFVIAFVVRQVFWFRLVGGALLIVIGVLYYFKKPGPLEKQKDSAHSNFVTAFLLCLTNPTTVLSFLAVLAALGESQHRPPLLTLALVGGIFAGSMAWWILLVLVVDHFRDRFDERGMFWLNRIAGFAIGGFGTVTMILALTSKR